MTAEQRLTELEMQHTHLQRTLEDLSAVVLEQAKEIDQLRRQLSRLVNRTDTLEQHWEDRRDPRDEKPPHY